ncbi:MAG: AI-2E family transporter [Anaerolineae bacterium]|nr:AI-2E family transporter [Gemmatimonadaceae bacterium]
MPESILRDSSERRRVERRTNQIIAELTLPEFRRIALTSLLFTIVLFLFLWMVRTVIIAGILAIIVATYMRPFYKWILRMVHSSTGAALLTILCVAIPLIAIIVYSYIELSGAAGYLSKNEAEIVERIDAALRRLPFFEGKSLTDQIRNGVLAASNYGSKLVGGIKATMAQIAVSTAVFLFTAFYFFTSAHSIAAYIRGKIPPRYGEISNALERNVRGVLYGAIYATLMTQTIKSIVILAMNLAFQVPLALVLAILSFVIGFFPIVGSWSVYVPVALWLGIFRDAWGSALAMLVIGFLGNTLFMSMYIRPKIAAEKSKVLNFYWMFIGLVTGVYTFGLVGVLLGPIVIGLLKATVDTVTAQGSWKLLDADGDTAELVIPK